MKTLRLILLALLATICVHAQDEQHVVPISSLYMLAPLLSTNGNQLGSYSSNYIASIASIFGANTNALTPAQSNLLFYAVQSTNATPVVLNGPLNVNGSGNVLTYQRPQNATPNDFEQNYGSSYPQYTLNGTGPSSGYLAEPSPFVYSNIQYLALAGWTNGSPQSNGCIVFAYGPTMANLTLLNTSTITASMIGAGNMRYVSGPSVYQWGGTNYMDVFASTNYTFESTLAQEWEGWSTGDPTAASNWHFQPGFIFSNTASGFMSGNIYRCFTMPLDGTGNNWIKYFNAAGDPRGEAIGFATSSTGPLGPWVLYSGNPIFTPNQATNIWKDAGLQGVGDPDIIPVNIGNTPAWLMFHATLSGSYYHEGKALSFDMTNWTEISSNVPIVGNLVFQIPNGAVRIMYQNTGKEWLGVGDNAGTRIWFFKPSSASAGQVSVAQDFYTPGGSIDLNGNYAIVQSLTVNGSGNIIDTTSGHTIGTPGSPWSAFYGSAFNGGTFTGNMSGGTNYNAANLTGGPSTNAVTTSGNILASNLTASAAVTASNAVLQGIVGSVGNISVTTPGGFVPASGQPGFNENLGTGWLSGSGPWTNSSGVGIWGLLFTASGSGSSTIIGTNSITATNGNFSGTVISGTFNDGNNLPSSLNIARRNDPNTFSNTNEFTGAVNFTAPTTNSSQMYAPALATTAATGMVGVNASGQLVSNAIPSGGFPLTGNVSGAGFSITALGILNDNTNISGYANVTNTLTATNGVFPSSVSTSNLTVTAGITAAALPTTAAVGMVGITATGAFVSNTIPAGGGGITGTQATNIVNQIGGVIGTNATTMVMVFTSTGTNDFWNSLTNIGVIMIGGPNNYDNSDGSSDGIVGGNNNQIQNNFGGSFIFGGVGNYLQAGSNSMILSGFTNSLSGPSISSFIIGGSSNNITGSSKRDNFIIGGESNYIFGNYNFEIGPRITASSTNTFTYNGNGATQISPNAPYSALFNVPNGFYVNAFSSNTYTFTVGGSGSMNSLNVGNITLSNGIAVPSASSFNSASFGSISVTNGATVGSLSAGSSTVTNTIGAATGNIGTENVTNLLTANGGVLITNSALAVFQTNVNYFATFIGNTNYVGGLYVQNTNGGTSASSDLEVWADNGGINSYNLDFGINGSRYNSSGANSSFPFESNACYIIAWNSTSNYVNPALLGGFKILSPATNSAIDFGIGGAFTAVTNVEFNATNAQFNVQILPTKDINGNGVNATNFNTMSATTIKATALNVTNLNVGTLTATNLLTSGGPTNSSVNLLGVDGTGTNYYTITNAFVLVNTNWISGNSYVNGTGHILDVRTSTSFTLAAVAGAAQLQLRIVGSITNFDTQGSAVTGVFTGTETNATFCGLVPVGATFTFTNTSTGAGNSATPTSGTGQYMTEGL